jgi:hypothetical protein
MRRLPVVTLLMLAVLCAAAVGGCGQPKADDLSVPCRPAHGPFAVRCIGGVSVADVERVLGGIGYDCQVLHGVDHSVDRCRPGPAGPGAGGVVDIDGSQLLGGLMASGCGMPGNDQVRALFETVARIPYPTASRDADRAASWVDANLDGREHQTWLRGYLYAVGQRPGDSCLALGITA